MPSEWLMQSGSAVDEAKAGQGGKETAGKQRRQNMGSCRPCKTDGLFSEMGSFREVFSEARTFDRTALNRLTQLLY